jgi:hypothetical protein
MTPEIRTVLAKSYKIEIYRAALVYYGPLKKSVSTNSRVINEVVLEEEFSEIGRSREECTKTSSVAHHYHMA